MTNNPFENSDTFDPDKLALADATETPDGQPIHRKALETFVELLQTPLDEEYVFCVDAKFGDRYLQRIRTIQSKMRSEVRKLNRQPKIYKIVMLEIKEFPTHDEVRVKRTLSRVHQMAKEMREILNEITVPKDEEI